MSEPLRIWHPFTQRMVDPAPLRAVRAEGAYLYTDDGRKILDGISSWWVNLHGHGHPAIAAAIAEQARRLEHILLAGFTHDAAERLATRLRRWLPAPLTHIFFSDDGSTAVEVALKMAVQYWRNAGRQTKTRVVALEGAYHGDTVGAMSVSEEGGFTAAFSSMRFPVERVHSAYCYRCPVGKKRETCSIDCTEKLARLLAEHHDTIAAVIVEPLLQGVAGMVVHPVEFLQRIRELCTRHGVLLIADEVLTGFGRTGRMFACERAGVVPDLMCLSKGITGGFLPMGATLCAGWIEEAFASEDRSATFFHGHSYTGNPLACAAAIANLEIFETEPVFERIAAIARIHQERLAALGAHPLVGEVRSIGAVGALELRDAHAGYFSNLRPVLYDFFVSRNVLLRPLGNVIYVLPPYCIASDEQHHIYDVVGDSLEHLRKQL